MSSDTDITALLQRWRDGDVAAHEALTRIVYPVLRAMARRQLSGSGAITLSPTELAHEAYLDLAGKGAALYQNQAHFYAIAAQVLRRVVIDHFRERGALKRGGDLQRVTMSAIGDLAEEGPSDVLDLLQVDALLDRLQRINARAANVVELRYFGGLSAEEIAEVQGCSVPTVKRDWQFARAWLRDQLENAAK